MIRMNQLYDLTYNEGRTRLQRLEMRFFIMASRRLRSILIDCCFEMEHSGDAVHPGPTTIWNGIGTAF